MLYTVFDEHLDLVHFRSEGVITSKELYTGIKAAFDDPRFHPDLRLFTDHSQGDFSAITSLDKRNIAQLNKFSPTARKAVLVRNQLQFGLGNVLTTYHEINNKAGYRYFYHRHEAIAFLNDGFPPDKHFH